MAELVTIGKIRTPYTVLEDCPKNVEADGPVCTLEVDSQYAEALTGLERRSHIQVLYWLDGAKRDLLMQNRRGDGEYLGTFALRSPHRPNPIGSSVVELIGIEGTQVSVRGLDCLDGTPLLDIKPANEPYRKLSIK